VTGQQFMRYMQHRIEAEHPSWISHDDPAVEMWDGTVRVLDNRGESCALKAPLPRQLRALATMLQLCADELERRSFER
jgi:hypothetical protein